MSVFPSVLCHEPELFRNLVLVETLSHMCRVDDITVMELYDRQGSESYLWAIRPYLEQKMLVDKRTRIVYQGLDFLTSNRCNDVGLTEEQN